MRLPNTHLKNNFDDLFTEYFVDQNHDSLAVYLNSLDSNQNHFVEVTTHSKLLTSSTATELESMLKTPTSICLESLQQFHSEEDFRKAINKFIEKVGLRRNVVHTLICQVDGGEESSRNLLESSCPNVVSKELHGAEL